MIQKVNEYRKSKGKSPLCYTNSLLKAAVMQAKGQATMKRMTHDGVPGEESLDKRLKKAGFVGSSWAENVGVNSEDNSSAIFDAWTKSKHHNENLLGKYNCFGYAEAKSDQYYYAQVFGSCGPEKCLDAGNASPTPSKQSTKNSLNEVNETLIIHSPMTEKPKLTESSKVEQVPTQSCYFTTLPVCMPIESTSTPSLTPTSTVEEVTKSTETSSSFQQPVATVTNRLSFNFDEQLSQDMFLLPVKGKSGNKVLLVYLNHDQK